MYCNHCNTWNPDGSQFCSKCGAKIVEEAAPAPQQSAPAQPEQTAAQPAPTGLQKILYLIGGIASVLAMVLLVGLFFGSGPAAKAMGVEANYFITTDFFSANGIWKVIIEGLKAGKAGISSVLGLLFSAILTLVGLVVLVVFLIIGIIKFFKGIKTGNYDGVNKTAIKMYGIFATIELLILSFNASNSGMATIGLNSVSLAAFCLCAILIGANIVLHLIAHLKANLGLKKLLKLVFTLVVLAVGAIIAGLASGAIMSVGEGATNFFALFINNVMMGGGIKVTMIIYPALGWIASFALILLGVSLIKKMMSSALNQVDGKPAKFGLGLLVTAFIFGAVLVAATILYASKADLVPSIVIAVFALVGFVLSMVSKKLFDK